LNKKIVNSDSFKLSELQKKIWRKKLKVTLERAEVGGILNEVTKTKAEEARDVTATSQAIP
jgi:hypothetical protein